MTIRARSFESTYAWKIFTYFSQSRIMYSLLIDPTLNLTRCPLVEKIETIEYWDLGSDPPCWWRPQKLDWCLFSPADESRQGHGLILYSSRGSSLVPPENLFSMAWILSRSQKFPSSSNTLRRPWSCPKSEPGLTRLARRSHDEFWTNFSYLLHMTNQRYFP